MAKPSFLDQAVCYAGMAAGVFGVLFTIYMYLVLGGAADSMRDIALNQADSAISILADARVIVDSTAGSMDSLTRFAKNSTATLNQSADSLSSMGIAVSALASSLGSVPFVPAETVGPLYSAGNGLVSTAADMREASESMQSASDEALATGSGIISLREDIDGSVQSLNGTKEQIISIHGTVRLGLFLGSALAILLFGLNALSFYRQLAR